MNRKRNAELIRKSILEVECTREILIEKLQIDNHVLDNYLSGITYFDNEKYLLLLEIIGLKKEALGFVENRAESLEKNPFRYFVPHKDMLIMVKKGIVNVLKSIFRNKNKKSVKELFVQDLFLERNHHTPILFFVFFLSLVGLIIFNYFVSYQITLDIIFISFLIPFAMLILIFEIDRSKINLLNVLSLFFFGGIFSLGLTFAFRDYVGYPTGFFGNILTGLVEETAKLIIALLLIRNIKINNVFTALLIGFSVGVGFEIFETMEYGMLFLLDPDGGYKVMISILWLRGILALGIGHHFWTGIIVATLFSLNTKVKLEFKTLYNPIFLAMFIVVIMFHALWNNFSYLLPVMIIQTILGLVLFVIFAANIYKKSFIDSSIIV